jgi:hypothetical protein
MYTDGGVDVYTHVFLISVLIGGECSASRSGRFTNEEKSPRYLSDKKLVGLQSRSARYA